MSESEIDPTIPVYPIGHVRDFIVGQKYWIQILCKTKKAFREAGEKRQVRLLSGTFKGLYDYRRRVYASFTGLSVEDSNANYISYDHGNIKVPNFSDDATNWFRKPIFSPEGRLIKVRDPCVSTFGHQELDVNTKFSKIEVFFDCAHWVFGENPPRRA